MLAMMILGAAGLVMAAEERGSRYVVVVSAELERGEAEALIGVYGGSRDGEQPQGGGGKLVVRMSPARAEMLRRDPRVVSVVEQRLHLSPRPKGSGNMTLGAYAYDGAGNIKRLGEEQSPQDQYVYDALGRLVSATAGMTNTQTYQYDAFGNRTTVTRSGSDCTGDSACEVSGTYVAGTNHLSSNGAQYDAAGNLIAHTPGRYVYDATGMMMRSSVGTQDRQYLYTAGDERIAVYDGTSNWRWTVRGADGKVLREFTSTNNGTSYGTLNRQWVKDYIWREGLLLATDSRTVSGTVATHHYHLDHLGTPRLVTDGAGAKVSTHTYYAFGAELETTPESPETVMKFTGHERDLTGSSDALDYMHARYYSALQGRFLSVDPVLESQKALRYPQRWNRYSYTVNNPVRDTDPTGKVVVFQSGIADEIRQRKLQAEQAKLEAYALELAKELFKTRGMDSKTALNLYWNMAVRLGTAAATHGAKATTETRAKGMENATIIASAAALSSHVRNSEVGGAITIPLFGPDTLHHFFANAINTFEGVPVRLELFGANFIRGESDPRDIKANNAGAAFGDLLQRNPNALPSDVIP
jgi:RHS repeat-associated protein